MSVGELQIGDVVYARSTLFNDGSIPELAADAVVAREGTRGVVVNIGHVEEAPDMELLLVRFEDDNLELGPPTGCWPDEIRSG